MDILVNVKVAKACKGQGETSWRSKNAKLQPLAVGIFHKFLVLMLSEMISRSPKAQINLSGNQAHANNMTKLELSSHLLPTYSLAATFVRSLVHYSPRSSWSQKMDDIESVCGSSRSAISASNVSTSNNQGTWTV